MLSKLLIPILILTVLSLGYTYLGYPAVLLGLSKLRSPNDHEEFQDQWPSVTMIVPVHNEASIIKTKLDNCKAIEYPNTFRCLFASDSTDETDELIRSVDTDQIELLSLPERRGKSYAINQALSLVDADIVVFSDANTMYRPDAVKELVAPLFDCDVGCVSGNLQLQGDDGSPEGGYWRYELAIRRLEASLGTTVSINGGMLAFRRADLTPLPERSLTDDYVLAMRQAREGKRIMFAQEAIGTENTAGSILKEFRRRVRIGAGNYQVLAWFADLLIPRSGRIIVTFEYVSHKVLRWLAPWLLMLAFVSNLALVVARPSPLVLGMFGIQLLGYVFATIGLMSNRSRSQSIFRIPAYFVAMNAAFALGCFRVFTGATANIWKVTSRK